MTTTTIQITPRAFGNIAAAAISLGCDVTTYLVRTAITRAPVIEETPEHRAALPHVAAPAAAVAPAQPSPKLTRSERRAARAAELERQRAVYAAPLTPATEPHSLRVEGYDPEFTPNPENFGQLS
ncbi:MAG: hypothetical protein IJ943_09300 [Akkermansia sp.]|nr:hypothetical protein [Akkermansia sp.]